MSTNQPSGKSPARLKRVKILKKVIVTFVLTLIFLPLAMAIYFGCMAVSFKEELKNKESELNYYMELQSEASFQKNTNVSFKEDVSASEASLNEPYKISESDVSKLSLKDEELYAGYKKVYLTFDDGPGPNTDEILDILDRYNVKATFFVIRKDGRNNEKLYQRIAESGHSLGMHSCTHVYKDIYQSVDAFKEDTKELRDFLYLVTGVESDIYRFPGGSSNNVSPVDMHEFANELSKEGIVFFDWNISSQDATAIPLGKDRIVKNVTSQLSEYNEAIILFHDLDEKRTTVEALPEIIEYIQSMKNTVILPITRDTNPIQHLSVK